MSWDITGGVDTKVCDQPKRVTRNVGSPAGLPGSPGTRLVERRNSEGFPMLVRDSLTEFRLVPGAAERAAEKVAADVRLTITVDNGIVDIK